MFIEYTTTITHRIELGDEGIKSIEHSVSIDAGEASALGESGILLVSKAGCKAALNSLNSGRKPDVVKVTE
jgi:hypothetical protein